MNSAVVRALLLVLLLVLLPATSAAASPARAGTEPAAGPAFGATADAGGGPLFGAALEWGEDSAAGFAERLGATAAIFGHDIAFPLQEAEKVHLREFFRQSDSQGAHALLTVKPSRSLDQLSAGDAAAFARTVEQLSTGFQGTLYIRFAPDMNTSWVSWGQQPEAYRNAFRDVAAAFESEDDAGTVMVWQPFLGRDYPFQRNRNAPAQGSGGFRLLDTNGDGRWDGADNPYSPYYPGDDAVEWAGLGAYHDDTGGATAVNTLPPDGELAGMLTGSGGRGGYGDFYADYVQGRSKPLMLQTAAFFSSTTGGPAESEIKLAWWNQVLDVASSARFGKIGAVVWDERTSTRDTGVAAIDWRLTGQPGIASAAGARLADSALVTGPVTVRGGLAGDESGGVGKVLGGIGAWTTAGALAAVVGMLWLLPRFLPRAAGWAYGDPSPRDSRVDFLRGLAIVFVVVNHVGMTSLFQLFTQEAVGFVSGAELFVLFSGLVLGMVFGPRVRDSFGDVVDHTTKRAGKLYATALVVLIGVFLISLVPAINADTLTSFVDQGTGAAGRGGAGRSYDLYAGMESLLHFPVAPEVIPGILLLKFGPWQFNVMGLYVILLLASPLVLWALSRGKVLWVLAATTALYAAGAIFRIRLLPSEFEDSFPLLVWQVLFILGMVAGYHRRRIIGWMAAHSWVVAACTVLAAGLAFLAWGNPYLANSYDVRVAVLPDTTYRALYDAYFGRTYLGVGRLLNVMVLVVAAYALLTAYWKPVHRAVGWFLIPLGRATLYVFIIHVALIAVIANIPALQEGRVLFNTAAYAVILALLWVMVRTRFLFRIIPT
ncbi:OpgC domain-containing protein [Arthrobacter sp. NPDC058097]|uniref:OpgC domain-containing protein n=1 Tax=Arthrobacter sp. NPDC058097 TaxID=3346340 RepID=UPI0036DF892B